MSIFTVACFLSFILFLEAGIYALWKSPGKRESVVFAILSFLFAIYALSYTLFFSAESIDDVYYYDRIASIGWVFFPVVTVLLCFFITNTPNRIVYWIWALFLVPLSVYSFYVSLTDLESVKLFYEYEGVWFYTPYDGTLNYFFFVFYLIVAVLICYFVLINWFFVAVSNREKHKARISLLSLSVFFTISFLSNLFFPFLEIHILPALAPINALFLVMGMFYILYGLPKETLSADIVYKLIVNHVKEFLFIADSKGKIQTTNQYTLTNLKYNNYEIARSDYQQLFNDPDKISDAIRSLGTRSVSRQIRTDLIARNNDRIPVLIYVIKVTDHFRRLQGFVLSCIDYRQKLNLRDEVAERVRTEKNLSQIRRELEILVRKRTRELQEANMRLQQEVAERKSAEEQIKADLNQKILLVQEVHHRVKNNIQVIISLVNMLCHNPKIDSNASEKLREVAEKVRYISSIHEDFYTSPNLSSIAFSSYLKKAIGELYSHFGRRRDITFKLNLQDENLDINQAIPLGIVFNELMINALLYAFNPDNKSGSNKSIINVEFYRSNGSYALIVSDNGIASKNTFNDKKSDSIGLQLVNVLIREHLKGKLSHFSQNGTTFIVNFEPQTQ